MLQWGRRPEVYGSYDEQIVTHKATFSTFYVTGIGEDSSQPDNRATSRSLAQHRRRVRPKCDRIKDENHANKTSISI